VKVLMTADTAGGVFTYAAELSRALRREGVDVVLATMGGPLRADQRAALDGVVHESGLRLEWMEDPWDDVAAAGTWLLELCERERPDVVHLNGFAHGALAWPVPAAVVAHSDVVSWWRAVHGADPPAAWDRYRAAVGAGLRGADALVAITAAVARDLHAAYGVPVPPVVSNGSRAPARSAAKAPFVLGAGRLWDRAKNLAALDAAAAGLAWPVVVAGALGDARPRHARAVGHRSARELSALRARAAIFCAPARYEPFGLAILEAARDRCALVLGDVPSLREVWGDAARYVDPGDTDAVRAALAELIDRPALRDALAARAQRRSERYTTQAAARRYRALYDGVRARVPA